MYELRSKYVREIDKDGVDWPDFRAIDASVRSFINDVFVTEKMSRDEVDHLVELIIDALTL